MTLKGSKRKRRLRSKLPTKEEYFRLVTTQHGADQKIIMPSTLAGFVARPVDDNMLGPLNVTFDNERRG